VVAKLMALGLGVTAIHNHLVGEKACREVPAFFGKRGCDEAGWRNTVGAGADGYAVGSANGRAAAGPGARLVGCGGGAGGRKGRNPVRCCRIHFPVRRC